MDMSEPSDHSQHCRELSKAMFLNVETEPNHPFISDYQFAGKLGHTGTS